MTARIQPLALFVATSLVFAAPAAGQSSAGSSSKWQVEIHGGGLAGAASPAGTGISQFPVGPAIVTGGGGRGGNTSSRAVSSWFFGDGATLMNDVNAGFGVTARIAPLDEALRRGIVGPRAGGVMGVRVSRQLSSRMAAEIGINYTPSAMRLTDEGRTAIAATQASFVPAWNALLATGNTSARVVTSGLETDDGGARQTQVTGALRFELRNRGSARPYVTAGGGAILTSGTPPEAVLTGHYSFDFAGSFPMDETDVVRIRAAPRETTWVGLVGGGVTIDTSPRRGWRIDARLLIGRHSPDTVVDAAPTVRVLTPAFSILTGGNPSIQFSNNPSIGRQSSLSGQTDGLRTFTGDGVRARAHLSVGYFFRF